MPQVIQQGLLLSYLYIYRQIRKVFPASPTALTGSRILLVFQALEFTRSLVDWEAPQMLGDVQENVLEKVK